MLLSILLLLPGCTWFSKEVQTEETHKTRVKLVILDEVLEEYRSLIGEYPTELRELIDGPNDPALKSNWDKPLIAQGILVDGWSQEFVYKVQPEGSESPYDLYSIGEPGGSSS